MSFKVTKDMRRKKSKAMRQELCNAGTWRAQYNQDIISIYCTRGGGMGTTFTQKSRTLQGYSKRWGR